MCRFHGAFVHVISNKSLSTGSFEAACKILVLFVQLEIVFMKHCAPTICLSIRMVLFHLKFEASSYTRANLI